MTTLREICDLLEHHFPASLAESWDNVGLLVGDSNCNVGRMMTCLTITPEVVTEAVREQANLIVAHHPLPFRPVKRITTDDYVGGMLWKLANAGIAVYSAHTAYDSAATGINQQWTNCLGLENVQPLIAASTDPTLGTGRAGDLPKSVSLRDFALALKNQLSVSWVQIVGAEDRTVRRVGIACGAGADFFAAAKRAGCHVLLTGEARFHTCLEATATEVSLVLLGHYVSERPAMEHMAAWLQSQFPALAVWASRDEQDPIQSL
jgi:dinuclear metal center YbgI/SA1388 family protein